MSATKLTFLQIFTIVTFIGGIGILFSDEINSWWAAIPFGLFAVCIYLYTKATSVRDLEPDVLTPLVGRGFERDGVRFAPVVETLSGRTWLRIYCMNKWTGPARVNVLIRATRTVFKSAPKELDTKVSIDLERAEAAVFSVPWEIPVKFAGKRVLFDVAASTRFPAGRGTCVRFAQGLACGSVKFTESMNNVLMGAALVGAMTISRPARVKLPLPEIKSVAAGNQKTIPFKESIYPGQIEIATQR